MLSNFVKGRVYVFIDAENVFYTQRALGWKISYERLITYLRKECGLQTVCFVYKGIDEKNIKQKKFLDMLDINGYRLRTKSIKKIKFNQGGYRWKNNLDIELALEMVETKNMYDTALLMSGDSDFAPAIDRIKQAGKRIIVMSTRWYVSKELLDRAKYIDLAKIKFEISQK